MNQDELMEAESVQAEIAGRFQELSSLGIIAANQVETTYILRQSCHGRYVSLVSLAASVSTDSRADCNHLH